MQKQSRYALKSASKQEKVEKLKLGYRNTNL